MHNSRQPESWQTLLLVMLPQIQRHLRFAFRRLRSEARDEAISEATANICVAVARLVERGCADRIYATALARFAAAQVGSGRQVATPCNKREVLSLYAQSQKGFYVTHFSQSSKPWWDIVLTHGRTPILDQVCFRIDFPNWLRSLALRDRKVALALATGYTTKEVAQRFQLSPGRISQLRRELLNDWSLYQGEDVCMAS